MIVLTRSSGERIALNADLIERIDSEPDTVIVMADGARYHVVEDLDRVVGRVQTYRACVRALADQLEVRLEPGSGHVIEIQGETSLRIVQEDPPT